MKNSTVSPKIMFLFLACASSLLQTAWMPWNNWHDVVENYQTQQSKNILDLQFKHLKQAYADFHELFQRKWNGPVLPNFDHAKASEVPQINSQELQYYNKQVYHKHHLSGAIGLGDHIQKCPLYRRFNMLGYLEYRLRNAYSKNHTMNGILSTWYKVPHLKHVALPMLTYGICHYKKYSPKTKMLATLLTGCTSLALDGIGFCHYARLGKTQRAIMDELRHEPLKDGLLTRKLALISKETLNEFLKECG